jgi:S1-C subfamily serine protease
LVSKVRPTVVNITVRGGGDDRAGSGIVLRPEGIVATSARLVQGATAVNVTFSSGLAVQADLVGIDLPTDVAVLRVDERELAAISRGTVGFLELGEPVVALSSPVEMYASVSTGVIASLGRPVSTPDGALLLDMIHVDAPLPATGTGGAVIREGGSVVGMVSAVTEGAGGTGFFVPIDLVYAVADQLASGRDEVVHPYIGAIVTPIDRSTGLPIDARGFVVAIVANGSPASEAGIEPSDIIVGIDGEPVEGTLTLTTKLLTKSPGDDIVLTIWRDGRTQDIRVEVGDLPEQP